MWTKFIHVCFILTFTFKQNTAQVAPFGEGDCCEIEMRNRVPCAGGSNLRVSACIDQGCCHDNSEGRGDNPVCFARKDAPCGRCKVAINRRQPCGGWTFRREVCENLGCCFDKRSFPYCYMTSDGKPMKTPSTPTPQRRRSNIGGHLPTENYWVAAGPNEKYFDPVGKEMLEVYCPTDFNRNRCSHADVQRDECLDVGCCWNPNLGSPVCFNADKRMIQNETMLDAVVQQLGIRNETTDDSESGKDGSPVSQFSYQNFSVAVECPLMSELSTKQKCGSKTRVRCLEENCCWIQGQCIIPYSHFKGDVGPKKPALPDQALLADYWIPSTIEIYVENTTMQLMCNSGKQSPQRCGQPGITRTQCVSMECCWQPLLAFDEKSDVICTLPVILEDSIEGSNGHYDLGQWGDWQMWSECSATEEGTPLGGKRVRRRECFAPQKKPDGILSCSGPASESMDCRDLNGCILGDWSSWTKWTQCSETCSPGIQRRFRRCALEEALDMDPDCDECADAFVPTEYDQTDERSCNENLCPRWLEWREGDCNCGERVNRRNCDPQYIAVDLGTHNVTCFNNTVQCSGGCYPKWSEWGRFSPCTQTCEVGYRMRTRNCIDEDGGLVEGCEGTSTDSIPCNTGLCQEWSTWELEGECQAECEGSGEQRSTRNCLNPVDIDVDDECRWKYVQCNGSKCFGDWEWTPWSECEDTCGPSAINRTKLCVYKNEVTDDISRCIRKGSTEVLETALCNEVLCHNWGEWNLEDDCNANCRENGSQTMSRPCLDEDMPPLYLDQTHEESCYKIKVECFGASICPPAWSDWGSWSSCSETCSSGVKAKTRTCLNDEGLSSDECAGGNITIEVCNEDKCNNWGDWGMVEECDALCETSGLQKASRKCLEPMDFATFDEECWMRKFPCNGSRCTGTWTTWDEWAECQDSCSPSVKTRTRSCIFNGVETLDLTRCQKSNESTDIETSSCNEDMCLVWGDWSLQNDCNAPCRGNGTQTISRLCLEPMHLLDIHPNSCYMATEKCLGEPTCPPEWSEWGNWSLCSASCMPGVRSRERVCRNEFGFEDDKCAGEKLQTEDCNFHLCQEWGDWELVGDCIAPCEEPGHHLSVRTCTTPSDFSSDDRCSRMSVPCEGERCMGEWDTWGPWSNCFDSCGPSNRSRTRNCIFNNATTDDLTRCYRDQDLSNQESVPCNENMCARWGNWTLQDDCDAPCRGSDLQTNLRTCMDELSGDVTELHVESCFRVSVACDGVPVCPPHWAQWSDWSFCSETCTHGMETRSRVCLTEDGEEVNECQGESNQTQVCNIDLCQEWGEWTPLNDCDADCEGPGVESLTRECVSPSDYVVNNNQCNIKIVSCTGPRCLGDWETWSAWSNCHDTCSPSSKNRTRKCIFNGTEHGDLTRCDRGEDISNVESLICNDFMCQLWGEWDLKNDCNAPCRKTGLQTSSRICMDDVFNESNISDVHEIECYNVKINCVGPPTCPPSWSEWESWSPCSETCTEGTRTRTRSCFSEEGVRVIGCLGEAVESESCNNNLCLEWNEWELDGDCDAPCEETGHQQSLRICNNPVGFVDENNDCHSRQLLCNGTRCYGDWNEWSAWSNCFDACGPSVINRTRDCIFNGEITDDLTRCHREGNVRKTETLTCNEDLCQEWGEWSLESNCNAACRETGLQTRSRKCRNDKVDLALHDKVCHTIQVSCLGPLICPPSWNEWGSWTSCSKTCTIGNRNRQRHCLTEDGFEANTCKGEGIATENCNGHLCLEWEEWQLTGECNAKCEHNGTQVTTRVCINPLELPDDPNACNTYYVDCIGQRCMGDWSNWGQWSECQNNCGPSHKNRTRSCVFNGQETYDLTRCIRQEGIADVDTTTCNEDLCHLWTDWVLQNDCNAPCRGVGLETLTRICEDIHMNDSILTNFHHQTCYERKTQCVGAPTCPPTWGEWGSWSLCSQSCTDGKRSRQRICFTEFGERVDECTGVKLESENCNEHLCLVWTDWKMSQSCNAKCENNGTEMWTRICENPTSFKNDSSICNTRYVSCNGPRCLGDWDEWGPWSDCYDNCSPSTQNRTRSCIFQGNFTHDLTRCITAGGPGNIEETICNEFMCQKWGKWDLKNDCDAPCRENGSQTLFRNCEHGEMIIEDLSTFHDQSCFKTEVKCFGSPSCPPSWAEWSAWSSCSESCAIGLRTRLRVCLTEFGDEVSDCDGFGEESESCNVHLCQQWNDWKLATICNAECEKNGTEVWNRECDNPVQYEEQNLECFTEIISCAGSRCRGYWDLWSPWSQCNDLCSPSFTNRTRFCIFQDDVTDDITRCQTDGEVDAYESLPCNEGLCQQWDAWSLNADCNAPCRGIGLQTRSRSCLDAEFAETDHISLHDESCYSQMVFCLGTPDCPPAWATWNTWSRCSDSCAVGERTRNRQCLTETGEIAFECEGVESQTVNCNEDLCIKWSDWQIAGECSAECEKDGYQLYARVCTNPPGFVNEQNQCNSRTVACTGPRCLGDWDVWSEWSECYDSCGPSYRNRSRHCIFENEITNDSTRCHTEKLSGDTDEVASCNEFMCENWSEWELEDDCDAPCRGNGSQTMSRLCNDNDASRFLLSAFHDQSCYKKQVHCFGPPTCPPSWSRWGPWSSCSESCSNGLTFSQRTCLTEDGVAVNECDGISTQTQDCNTDHCRGWGDWTITGDCSAECENNGTQHLTRICLNSTGFEQSETCTSRYIDCTGTRCMGNWNEWSSWSTCHDSCSPSMSNRSRLCIFRGESTEDLTRCQTDQGQSYVETRDCNVFMCRQWDNWSLQDDCNAECKSLGFQTTLRSCLDDGVTDEDLSSFHIETCYTNRVRCSGPSICPPSWAEWEVWSDCSDSCSVGLRTRLRRCLNDTGTEVEECGGLSVETDTCNEQLCQEWSGWNITGDCNADCEETGSQPENRVCINPLNYNGSSDECVSRRQLCTGPRCFGDWAVWTTWSICYDLCGPSKRNRTRYCIYNGKKTDDLTRCYPEGELTSIHTLQCNENMCHNWGDWALQGDCDAPCRGTGFQTNSRKCLDDVDWEDIITYHDQSCYSVKEPCTGRPTCPPTWSEWQSWSACSESCTNGTKTRLRQCLTEQGDVSDVCIGNNLDTGLCNLDLCLEWNGWKVARECDAECEHQGTLQYTRSCANPPDPVFDSEECNSKLSSCIGPRCMGAWSDWSPWGECGDPCGPAIKNRTRQCIYNGEITHDLTRCNEDKQPSYWETEECNEDMCSEWGGWNILDDCDAPCRGDGNQTSLRGCDSLLYTEVELNSLHPENCFKVRTFCEGTPTCPPSWSEWGGWSDCSETCSRGVKTRHRQCLSEFGKLLPTGCSGSDTGTDMCNDNRCITWGDWQKVDKCNAVCEENGTQRYERFCVLPLNFNAPSDVCSVKHLPCTGDICLGDWGTWGPWSDCEDTCTPSITTRNRDCIVKGRVHNEVSRCYRDNEKGSLTQSRVCNQLLCPSWGEWTVKDDCNAPCRGKGVRSRLRNCTISGSDSTSENVVSLDSHDRSCYFTEVPCEGAPTCPPEWSAWGNWSSCSQSCSVGAVYRQRICVTEFGELTDNNNCQGDSREEKTCNTFLCIAWNDWDTALSCDADCEEPGFKWSLRSCRNQSIPIETANECFQHRETCMGGPCPGTWGPWGQWSECRDRCGPSVRSRNRFCFLKGELVDSSRCNEGEASDTDTCNEIFCTNWMRWKEGNCTGPCGQQGIFRRERACLLNLVSLVRGNDLQTTFPGMPEDCYLKRIDCIVECIPQWTLWTSWSSCSTSCAPGEKVRTRECRYNESVVGPEHCNDPRKLILRDEFSVDGSTHKAPCNLDMCLTWSQWTGRCTAPCGEPGIRVKRRQCRFAINGENVVAVRNQAIAKCSTEQVPCTGECITNWLPWSAWSRCSESCGPGKSMRRRACYSQGRKIDEKLCFIGGVVDESVFVLVRDCNTEVCDSWTTWSGLQCSARCGSVGRRHKRRICDGTGEVRPLTSPLNDLSCFNVIERCSTPPGNLSYSNWLPWTRCSSRCERGIQSRFRTCKGESGCRVSSLDCRSLGPYRQQRSCSLSGCRRFSSWTEGACSASCGASGTLKRTRRCILSTSTPTDTPRESCFNVTRTCRGSCL